MSHHCQNEVRSKDIIGIVTDCLRLNIYQKPDEDSEIVTTVTCLDELCIDMTASFEGWYSVCTVVGIEGFCKKKYVAVRQ